MSLEMPKKVAITEKYQQRDRQKMWPMMTRVTEVPAAVAILSSLRSLSLSLDSSRWS